MTKRFPILKVSLLFLGLSILSSCNNDDDDKGFTGDIKEYKFQSVGNFTVDGVVTFIENENGSTTIEIELEGTDDAKSYSPKIHHGVSMEGGSLAVSLEEIEGDDGKSTTTITKLANNTAVSFEYLAEMDGHIVIYLIEGEAEVKIATADIGGNELTGDFKTYELEAVGDVGIAANIKLEERVNGKTLVTVTSDDTEEGNVHPAFIHSGAIGAEQGSKVITLQPLEEGHSLTNVSAFDEIADEEGKDVSYEDLLDYDGSLNIYLSEEDEGVIISQGNIGSNSKD